MNESVVLTRRLSIQGWRAVGSIAKAERRKELDPVLLRAGEMGETSAADVAEHLFFARSRRVIAERLLRIGTVLGLLEENNGRYTLTESGKRAIAVGKIFVPEYGTWDIWVSEDPLLPSPILRIEAADEPSAVAESRRLRDRERERSFRELPEEIQKSQGKELTPLASADGIGIRIGELERFAEAADARESLTLIWKVPERKLRLQGELGGRKVDSELEAPGRELQEIWGALLAGGNLSNDWDPRRGALRVFFRETTESERANMSRDVLFPAPSVPGFGEFDPVTVEGVDIAARSYNDARDWATWRLRERVRDYATSARYDEWWEEAAEPFAEYSPECPSRTRFAREARDVAAGAPTTRAWHLMAAEDWGL